MKEIDKLKSFPTLHRQHPDTRLMIMIYPEHTIIVQRLRVPLYRYLFVGIASSVHTKILRRIGEINEKG